MSVFDAVASEDAFVVENNPDAGYTQLDYLMVSGTNRFIEYTFPGGTTRTFIKFQIDDLIGKTISSATLTLYRFVTLGYGATGNILVKRCTDNGWSETSSGMLGARITWNNQPDDYGTNETSFSCPSNYGQSNVELDVKDFIEDAILESSLYSHYWVTFVLMMEDETSWDGCAVMSREYSNTIPTLNVVYTTPSTGRRRMCTTML